MELWELYLIATIPRVSAAFGVLAIVCVLAVLFNVLFGFIGVDGDPRAFRYVKTIIIVGLVATALRVVIPSERTLMIMVGGYAATNTEGLADLPPNLVGAANKFLEDYAGTERHKEGE